MAQNIIGAYVPDFQQAAFPGQVTSLLSAGIVNGACGFAASMIFGAICQRLFVRLPGVSLYTTCIGAAIAAACICITFLARLIAQGSGNVGCGALLCLADPQLASALFCQGPLLITWSSIQAYSMCCNVQYTMIGLGLTYSTR